MTKTVFLIACLRAVDGRKGGDAVSMLKRLSAAAGVALVAGLALAALLRPTDPEGYLLDSADAEIQGVMGDEWSLERLAAFEAGKRERELAQKYPHLTAALAVNPELQPVAEIFSAEALERTVRENGVGVLRVVDYCLDPANPIPALETQNQIGAVIDKSVTGTKRFVEDPADSLQRAQLWAEGKWEEGLAGLSRSASATMAEVSTRGLAALAVTTPLTREEAAEIVLGRTLAEGWSFLGSHYEVDSLGKVHPLPLATTIHFLTRGLTTAERKLRAGDKLSVMEWVEAGLDVALFAGGVKALKAAGAAKAAGRHAVLRTAVKGGFRARLATAGAKATALGRVALRSRIAKGAIATGVAYAIFRNPQWVTAAAGFMADQMGYPRYLIEAGLWTTIIGVPALFLAWLWVPLARWVFIPIALLGLRFARFTTGKAGGKPAPNPGEV